MKKAGKQLILISFFLALLAAGAVFVYLHSLNTVKAPKTTVKKISVWVASESIPAGTKVDKKMIKQIQVTDDSVLGNYIKDSSQIIGKYTKESITSNECFNNDMVYTTGGSEFTTVIEENHRAVSLNATGDSAVSYLIKPGDYVDVLVYLPEKKDGTKVIRESQARLILQNVKVLAIDRLVNRSDKTPDKLPTTFLVTLSIKTDDTEKIVLAENIGTLKLVLRPMDKENNVNSNGTTDAQLMVNDTASGQTASTTSGSSGSKAASYTVRRGDTLKIISKSFYGDPDKYTLIQKANNIQDENMIILGEVLKIPLETEQR